MVQQSCAIFKLLIGKDLRRTILSEFDCLRMVQPATPTPATFAPLGEETGSRLRSTGFGKSRAAGLEDEKRIVGTDIQNNS